MAIEFPKEFEESRKTAHSKSKKLTILGVVFLIAGFLVMVFGPIFLGNNDGALIGAILFIAGFPGIIIGGRISNAWQKVYGYQIIDAYTKSFYPDSQFVPNNIISIDVIRTPRFFPDFDHYEITNGIFSSYKDVEFIMTNYCLWNEYTDHDGHTTRQEVGRGKFFVFTFDREFPNTLSVLEKSMNAYSVHHNTKKVELESVEFNKKFMTLCASEHDAFYILTPQMQEYLLSLEKRFKGQIYFCFMKNHLFVAVNDSQLGLRVNMAKPLTDESMGYIKDEITIPKMVIETVKLTADKFMRKTHN